MRHVQTCGRVAVVLGGEGATLEGVTVTGGAPGYMMIPPTFQRAFAKRAGSTTVEIDSSHAVMLSHPKEVAAFIESAATAK